MKELGFKQITSDPCLYYSEGELLVVAIYVDDIILGGSCEANLNQMKLELSQKFEMKDSGQLHHFLGVKVIQDQPGGLIWIGQPFLH